MRRPRCTCSATWRTCPPAGEIVLFDRSWYNRAGVEHVMGFCTDEQYHAFLRAVPPVERTIVDNGIILIKYWFEVSQEQQTERFQERIDDGRKIWKLSGMDLESHYRWYDFSRARDAMFAATDTEHRAVVCRQCGRPAARATELHQSPAVEDSVQGVAARGRSSSGNASPPKGTWSRSGVATSCPKCIDAGLKRGSTA